MFRWLKTVPLTLAVAALSCWTTSCNPTSHSQIRLIDAISNGQQVDIYVNAIRIVQSMQFPQVYPPLATPASYVTVNSGSATIQGYPPGDTTNPIPPTGAAILKSTYQYTVVAVGLELSDSAPMVIVDDNTPPPANQVEFRVINASLNSASLGLSPGGVDVYFVPPSVTDLTDYTPQISGLGYAQPSSYQQVNFLSTGYQVIMTAHGAKIALLTYPNPPNPPAAPPWPATGSITTFVLLDNAGGNNGMSTTPLVLNDLN
jgi:hypothetical protein